MATLGDLTARINLDNAGFRQGMAVLNRELRVIQSEFRAASARLGSFGSSLDRLRLQSTSLSRQMDLQRQQVQALEAAYRRSVAATGEHSRESQNLATRLNNARAAMANTENELRRVTDELERQSSAWYRLSTRLRETGERLQGIGSKISAVGKNLSMALTVPIAGLGAVITKTGMQFEAAMSEVGAVSGATGDELKALEEKAKELGSTTKFSASEAAEGLKYMAMAGWQTQQMLDGIPGILNLAAASGEQLGIVSDIVTDAMTGFGMEAKRAGEFADTLAAASSNSNTNVAMLGESFKYVAPIAGALGYAAKDTAIALGLMANAGIKGSEAGTALRATLTRLVKPPADAAKAMQALGLSVTNSDGSLKSLATIMDELRGAFARLSPEQKAVFAAQIAGMEAMSGLLSVVNASEADFNKLSTAINGSAGAADRMATQMQDNLQGRITELKSAVEGLAIQLYEVLQPTLERIVATLKGMVDWFAGLSPAVQRTIVVAAAFMAALGPIILVLGGLIAATGAIVSAFGGLVAVFGAAGGAAGVFSVILAALSGPIGIVAGAIAALIVVITALHAKWGSVWAGIQAITTKVGDVLTGVWNKIGTGITVIAASITGLLLPKFAQLSAQAVVTAARVIAAWASMAASTIASTAAAVAYVVAMWAFMAARALASAARMAAAWVIAMGPVAWVGAAIAGLAALVATKTGAMASAVEWAKEKIIGAFSVIVNAFNKLRAALGGKAEGASVGDFRKLEAESEKASNSLGDFQGALDAAMSSLDGIGGAADVAGGKVGGAGGKMSAAAEKVKTAWTGTVEAIKSALGLMQTQHETAIIHAEIAGDKIEILRLRHQQLTDEIAKQKEVVAATRAEVDKAVKAGVLEGETKEDLAKRIDELNRKLADEEKAQAALEKQLHETSEAIADQGKAAKDLVAELKKVADTYYTDLANALDEYQKKVKDTNAKLAKDMDDLRRDVQQKMDDIVARGADRERQITEQFQRELDNRARALMDFVGLFDAVTTREVSGETLLKNLEGQVDAFDDWQENIAKLAERGIDEGLLQELREMGPKAGPEIAALLTLTDDQLAQYVELWKRKQEQAKDEAAAQMEQQRQEMNQQLEDIRRDTQSQLEQQRQEMAKKLEEMQAKAKEELEKYKAEWEKKNEEIRKNAEEKIADIHQRFNDLVGKATGYGISLMENFISGIDSMMPALISKLESVASTIDSYMPHSPAKRGPLRRIGEWGPALVGSLIDGIKRSLPELESITARMAMLSPGALQPALANSYNSTNNNYNNQTKNTFIFNVTGGWDEIERELAKRGVRF